MRLDDLEDVRVRLELEPERLRDEQDLRVAELDLLGAEAREQVARELVAVAPAIVSDMSPLSGVFVAAEAPAR